MRAGRQAGLVFWRQAAAALSDPGPSFVLPAAPPLLMVVVFTALFDGLGSHPDFVGSRFGTDGWDAYVVPGALVLVALLGAGYTSSGLASDLRSGYADRLVLAGGSAWPMLLGRLAFEAVRLVPGTLLVWAVGVRLGARSANGVAGIVVTFASIALLGVAFTGVFHLVAILTRDPQTPFTMQPLGLPLAFVSSALVPIALMPGWSAALARINPVSVVVDASRNALLGDLWSSELGVAVAILVAWSATTLAVTTRLLGARLEGLVHG